MKRVRQGYILINKITAEVFKVARPMCDTHNIDHNDKMDTIESSVLTVRKNEMNISHAP